MVMIEIIPSGKYRHDVYGLIHIKRVGTAQHIRARWRGPELLITVPSRASAQQVRDFYNNEEIQKKLMELKPKSLLSFDSVIETEEIDIRFEFHDYMPQNADGKCVPCSQNPTNGKKINYIIRLNSRLQNFDVDSPTIQKFLNQMISLAGLHATDAFVIPRAKELANQLGLQVNGWDIKDSKTALGKCSSRRIITLSPKLIFLPQELRDYVIYHELAHLTEMNHSAKFHEICNRYCGGREAELKARVDAFKFPVV